MVPSELFWWGCAGALIVAELMTGTFYLLMIAFGFVAGALAHVVGASAGVQYVTAAVVALVAVLVLRLTRWGRRHARRDASSNPDVNPDVGASLEVAQWRDRRARVPYRGAQWDVELAPGEPEDVRFYEIAAVRGNRLIVAAKKSATGGRSLSITKE